MSGAWRVGQKVRVMFTDKELEPGQSIDCQISGILQRNGQNALLFGVSSFSLFFADSEMLKILEWEYLHEAGKILALVIVGKKQFFGEWESTIELLPSEVPGGF